MGQSSWIPPSDSKKKKRQMRQSVECTGATVEDICLAPLWTSTSTSVRSHGCDFLLCGLFCAYAALMSYWVDG